MWRFHFGGEPGDDVLLLCFFGVRLCTFCPLTPFQLTRLPVLLLASCCCVVRLVSVVVELTSGILVLKKGKIAYISFSPDPIITESSLVQFLINAVSPFAGYGDV
ncbi:hypothetical protein Droror1_Dr00008740 [Drosera rotundifolia]